MDKFTSLHYLSFFALTLLLLTQCASTRRYGREARTFEEEIRRFEVLDRQVDYPDSSILFVGSSSIRLWETLAEDMAPYPVIQRGFGGSKFSDVAYYARRIIYPHEFRALVFFVGNDIVGGPADKTPTEVAQIVSDIITLVRKRYETEPIFIIEVTPNNSRWAAWPQVQQANRLMEIMSRSFPNVYFIATADRFLGADGKPISALFQADQLHLNEAGYALWTTIIKTRLQEILGNN